MERVLGSLPPARRTSEPRRGERDRKRPWPHRPACAREDNTRARVDVSTQEWRRPLASKPGEVRASLSECLLRGARAEAPRLAHATPNRGVTRGWRRLRAIWRRLVGRSPTSALSGVGERLGACGEVREVRASRSGVGGHQGCSLTTSWLQRSGERHPVFVGSSGWASRGAWSGGNGGGESAAASHNLDRREAVSVGGTGAKGARIGDSLFRLATTPGS